MKDLLPRLLNKRFPRIILLMAMFALTVFAFRGSPNAHRRRLTISQASEARGIIRQLANDPPHISLVQIGTPSIPSPNYRTPEYFKLPVECLHLSTGERSPPQQPLLA